MKREKAVESIFYDSLKKDSGSIFEKVTSTGLSGESYKSVS